jgi:group I intron endonuclease
VFYPSRRSFTRKGIKMKKKISGIYCIENKINHKKYIGKSVNISVRPYYYHNHSYALNAALEKYGKENFDIYVVEYCSPENLYERERYYIREWKTKSPNGYNLTDGGEGNLGWNPSPETRKNMGQSHIGNHASEETKKKMSNSSPRLSGKDNPAFNRPVPVSVREKISFALSGENNPNYGKTGTDSQNFGKKYKNSPSGFYGVMKKISHYKDKEYIYWQARVTVNRKLEYAGSYKTELEAACAYDIYVIEHNLPNPLNFPNNHN